MEKQYEIAMLTETELEAVMKLENQMREDLREEIVLIAYEKNN